MKNTQHISLFTLAILLAGFVFSFFGQPAQSEGYLRLAFLDIGQGDATLITTPNNQQILIDGGESYDSLSKAFQLLFIRNMPVALVAATHNHNDHIGGLVKFIENYPPQEVWISGAIHTSQVYISFLEALKAAKAKGTIVKNVSSGEEKTIDGVKLKVIYPNKDYSQKRPAHQHDANLVIVINYGASRFLLTGDLEQKNEDELVSTFYKDIKANVLKVSHHGSKYSTGNEFLEIVDPSIAVISVGADNRYNHPSKETIDRLNKAGAKILRTDQNGTIIIKTDGDKIWVE